jgi:nicotinamide mononucleotide transporter
MDALLMALRAMSVWEWFGTVFGIAGVVLTAKRSVLCWPAWLVSIIAYGVFFTQIKLYADAVLQVFFLITSILGWLAWQKDKAGDAEAELPVTWTPTRERWAYLVLTVISSVGIGFVFDRFTDAHVPYWDAGCAGISVAAQILMMKRRIESWHLWVVVDVVYTALYATKGAWLTVILYAIFAVIAIGGLREWRRSTTVRDA